MGSLGQFAAPIAVGLGAAVIVLASSVPLLATIPASVYGFASIAGLVLLGTGMSPTAALVPTILSVVIGAVFGYVSEIAANAGETARTGTFTATRSDLDHPGRREHDRAGARSRRQLSVRSRS